MRNKRIAQLLNCFIATYQAFITSKVRGGMTKGFTLIELITVVALMAFLSIVGIVAYRDYNQRQSLEAAAQDLATTIQLAKSRSISQVQPSECAEVPSKSLDGYRINIPDLNQPEYTLSAICEEVAYDIKTFKLPRGIEFDGATTISPGITLGSGVFFPIITLGVQSGGDIVIKGWNKRVKVSVDSVGTIKVGPFVPAIALSTPIIIEPVNGSSFGQGTSFSVVATTTCSGGTCTATQMQVNLSAAPGLSTTDPNPHDCGTLSAGGNCGKSWQINANSCGSQSITVTVSSTSTPSSTSSPTSVTISCPTAKRVFVTSGGYQGNLGGLTGAGTICDTEANNAGLVGTSWTAWLSTSSVNARDRITPASEYRLVDNTVVANGIGDLTDGTIDHAIDKDASGTIVTSGFPYAWTATSLGGNWSGSAHCDNWTNNTNSQFPTLGSWTAVDDRWTASGASSNCLGFRHLYCFEQ